MQKNEFRSLVELLRFRAEVQGDVRGYTFLVNGEAEGDTLTYGELERRSRALAALLRRTLTRGDRALLMYPPGLEFIAAFFGCLYAEIIAVPTYPPHPVRPSQSLPRLRAVAGEAGVQAVLCTDAIAARNTAHFRETPELTELPLLATDRVDRAGAELWEEPRPDPDGLAFLQYTSGSTAAPKGVMVSHRNLLHNLDCIRRGAGIDAHSLGVSWLPTHHDMGLIGGILEPLFVGFPSYLMAPVAFVQKPLRWLQAVSRYRATLSGGPDFGFDLCVHKSTPEQRRGLDLSCWRVAYNGAEPIRKHTLESFHRAFAPCGFGGSPFHPVYGLAEATLLVSSGRHPYEPRSREEPPRASGQAQPSPENGLKTVAVTPVSCGWPAFGTEVVIADPQEMTRVRPGEVGEIWVSSPSVAQGYWNRSEETERTFRAHLAETGEGPFLRTGDLGFVQVGELYVTGRIKDVMIFRGRKHYPQDVEHTVESSHPAVRPHCSAALSLPTEEGERLLILAEINHRPGAPAGQAVNLVLDEERRELDDLIGTIRQAVAEQHELQTYGILLLPPGGIPRTTSGKLQRHACRKGIQEGTFAAVAEWYQRGEPAGAALPARQTIG